LPTQPSGAVMPKLGTLLLVCSLLPCGSTVASSGPDEAVSLPIHLTDEERTRLHEIGVAHRSTAPPTGVLRNPGEWEPSEGVIIRWPLGISVDIVAEMSEDVVVTTIVAGASQRQSAENAYSAGGVNMANVEFVIAPTDSYWTRDYGPWFIFEDATMAIVDHVYNRPRPLDDVIPQVIGNVWRLDVYGLDLIHAGGNHMSEGQGMSMSTELVYHENPGKTQEQIHDLMRDYLGNDYTVLDYIESGGIHHIDCWAKLLGPSTVLVKEVDPWHSSYDLLNQRADLLSQQISAWGVPYDVVRVYCPPGTAYTNSLILNEKVLVPTFGSSWDAVALQTYRDAMPGYEVLGFPGSWLDDDALHCRAMGVPDRGMLFIDHVPFQSSGIVAGGYPIEATIVAGSGEPLIPGELNVRWSAGGSLWQDVTLEPAGEPDLFTAAIPAQSAGSLVRYYIEAADESGRVVTHPFIGGPWAHEFTARASVVTVANGSEGGTTPLGVAKEAGGLTLYWDAATPGCTSSGYHLVWGRGNDVATYGLSGADCTLDASGSHLWLSAPDTSTDWVWFLVLGDDDASVEGGWGTDASGDERSATASGECGMTAMSPGECIP